MGKLSDKHCILRQKMQSGSYQYAIRYYHIVKTKSNSIIIKTELYVNECRIAFYCSRISTIQICITNFEAIISQSK